MSTSVKINLESKKKLEELQAMLTLKLGRKIPQHEILDALIKLGSSNVDELVKHFSGVELPLPPEKIAKILSLPRDWGIKTSEEDINKILYEKED